MSAIGTKQTCRVALHMSAIGGKADIVPHRKMSAYDPKRILAGPGANRAARRVGLINIKAPTTA